MLLGNQHFYFREKSWGPEIQAAQESTRLYSVTEYGIINSRVCLKIINWPSADNRPIVWGSDNRPMHYRCISNYRLQQMYAYQ
jgi:hypothetical protein